MVTGSCHHQEASGIGVNYCRLLWTLLAGGSPGPLEGGVGVGRLVAVLIPPLTISVGLQLMFLP